MASTIVTKNSSTASAVPVTGDLTQGELAVNVTDKRLFTKNSGGTVVELGTNPASLALPNGTANGVAYLNGSKVVTTGSALTFDGTTVSSPVVQSTNGTITSVLSYSGGNSTGVIGTTSNHALEFRQNNTEQMRLTSTGLGIGTSSPNYPATIYKATFPTLQFINSASGTGGGDGLLIYLNGTTATISNEESGPLTFQTAGTLRATIDTSGNLGLGVTPSAWTAFKVMQLGNFGAVGGVDSTSMNMFANTFYDGAFKRINAAAATRYRMDDGHSWFTASSSTAGSTITFTQAMTLDASGNLGIANTSPGETLTVGSSSRSTTYQSIRAGTVVGAFETTSTTFKLYTASNHPLLFGTNNNEYARIDSSGNLIQSAPSTAPTLSTNGTMVFNLTSNTNLRVSVRGSDGVTRTANLTLA